MRQGHPPVMRRPVAIPQVWECADYHTSGAAHMPGELGGRNLSRLAIERAADSFPGIGAAAAKALDVRAEVVAPLQTQGSADPVQDDPQPLHNQRTQEKEHDPVPSRPLRRPSRRGEPIPLLEPRPHSGRTPANRTLGGLVFRGIVEATAKIRSFKRMRSMNSHRRCKLILLLLGD
jgi:hypothetical protein